LKSNQFEGLINRLEAFISVITKVLSKASSILLFLMMFLTAADVIGRFTFNKPVTGTYELSGLTLVLIIFFSLGSAQMEGAHLEIDVLTNSMKQKTQNLINGVTSFVLFILLCLTTWQLFEYGLRTLSGNQTSGDLGLQLYIFIFLAMIGSLAFTLTYFLQIIKSFSTGREK